MVPTMYFFRVTRYSSSIMVPTTYFFGLTRQSKSIMVPTMYFFGLTRSSKICLKFLLSTMYFSTAFILAPMPNATRTARANHGANHVLLWVDKVLEKHHGANNVFLWIDNAIEKRLGANIVLLWVDEVLEKMLQILVVDNVLLRRVDLSTDARRSVHEPPN